MSRAAPRRRPRCLPWALLCAAACLAWSPVAPAQEYEDAQAQALALEGEHEYAAAAAVLRLVLPLYPQDNALLLRIGADELLAGRFNEAEQMYRQALRSRQWPEESYLGLGLALEAQGACTSARVYLRSALILSPGEPSALAALDRCEGQEDWLITAQGFLTGQYYLNDPVKDFVGGGALGITASYRRSWQFKLLYRAVAADGKPVPPSEAQAVSAAANPYSGWVQQEVFGAARYGQRRFGVDLSLAFIHSSFYAIDDSVHLGLGVRYSPFGDLWLRTSASIYGSSYVLRGELSWRIPLGSVVSLQPGVAAYVTNLLPLPTTAQYPCFDPNIPGPDQNAMCAESPGGPSLTTAGYGVSHVMGSLTLSAIGRRGAFWIGGKLGDEYRPAYMDSLVVYDVLYHGMAGAWVGGEVPLDRRWSLSLQAAWDRYYLQAQATQGNGQVDLVPSFPDGFYLTLGASRRF